MTGGARPVPADDSAPEPAAARHPAPRLNVEIRPAERWLDPYTVTQAMGGLHGLLHEHTVSGGRVDSRRGRAGGTRAESMLVSDGRSDPSPRDRLRPNVVDPVEDRQGILQTCVPNRYEVDVVEWRPRIRIDELPLPTGDAAADCFGTGHRASDPTRPQWPPTSTAAPQLDDDTQAVR